MQCEHGSVTAGVTGNGIASGIASSPSRLIFPDAVQVAEDVTGTRKGTVGWSLEPLHQYDCGCQFAILSIYTEQTQMLLW